VHNAFDQIPIWSLNSEAITLRPNTRAPLQRIVVLFSRAPAHEKIRMNASLAVSEFRSKRQEFNQKLKAVEDADDQKNEGKRKAAITDLAAFMKKH
jgi:hypothetical protein